MNSFYKKLIKTKPSFLEEIESFSEGIPILKKLKSTNIDLTTFNSTISEFRFGQRFEKIGFELKYDFPYDNQKPDWTIIHNNEVTICEVYRLGKSKKDEFREYFSNQLYEEIELIPTKYIIRVSFLEEYFEANQYIIQEIINELNVWLSKNPSLQDKLIIKDNFAFEIITVNSKYTKTRCLRNINSIDIKPQKLKQLDSLKYPNKITDKLFKYTALINKTHSPYLLCIDIDFVSGFDFNDFVSYFRGTQTTFADYGKHFLGHPELNCLGETWSDLGIFYSNPQISGLLLRFNNEIRLLLNPNKNQVIYNNPGTLNLLEQLGLL